MSEGLDSTMIREHYSQISPVIKELADVDGHLTIGLNDYSGWYIRQSHDDFDVHEAGYEQQARCATLSKDYETIQNRIDRALYVLTTYKSEGSFTEWEPCTIEDGQTKWMDERPTPSYEDLRGVMVWGDIDLADELKTERGGLADEVKKTVEATLQAYIEEYARLYGDREAVFALDSVGGSYVMGAPAATLPIANLFDEDPDALERVMEAFVDRSNEWLQDAQKRVEKRVEGAAKVIDPDWVNNCNRQYKAPLSLHTDHDAVVVPLETDSPTYELVTFDAVDQELIEKVADWATELTSTEYCDCAETLVSRLWSEEYEQYEDWKTTLQEWVATEREREERQEEAQFQARQRRLNRKEQMNSGMKEAPLTPFISDVYDAIDALDIEAVADSTIVHQWTDRASGKRDNSGDRKRAFIPIWGPNAKTGNANFVDSREGLWVDTGDGYSGGPVKMALIAEENWERGETPSGAAWRRGVEYLRERGFDLPVHTPDADSQQKDGEKYERMPLWALRKAAVSRNVIQEQDFVWSETGNNGYRRFPNKRKYNEALAAVEDIGFNHGREYRTEDGRRPDDVGQSSHESEAENPSSPKSDSTTRSTEERTLNTNNRDESSENGEPASSSDFTTDTALDVEDGKYGYWRTNLKTGEENFEQVTNFTIEANSFLFDNERFIDMTIIPASGEEPYERHVSPKVFNDVRRFRDNVADGLTTTFDGGLSDLNELRELVAGQDAPKRTGTSHMGLHPQTNEFVTPNGVITSDGWTDTPETEYIEQSISAERAWTLTPETHNEYNPKQVAEILELVPKSRSNDRFLPVLGWLYAAPLRPLIQDWTGQFNTLHVTGETGAGKSSSLSLIWRLIGMHGEPMACDDTKFALLTSMASTNSIPMWFDEYKPGDMTDWEVDRFQNLMRSTTRGEVKTRGNADKSTDEYELQAPVMISGEQSIQGPAEARRSIQTRFRNGVKEPGSLTKAAYAKLTGLAYDVGDETKEPEGYDLEQHGFAYYLFLLNIDKKTLKDLWRKSRDHARSLLASNSITGVDDLPRQGVQTVHFGMTLYRLFAENMISEAGRSMDEIELPASEEVDDAMLYIAEQFGDSGSRKSHLDRFIELMSRAANEDYLEEGTHFTLVKEGTPDEKLALKLSSVHDRVSKYVRDHGLDGEDFLNTAKDYRDRMAEAANENTSYVTTHSQYTPPLNRCARINTDMAQEQLDFNRLSFAAEPRNSEGGKNEFDDKSYASQVGARPISEVAEEPTGYATVTVEVLSVEQPDNDDGPALKASVKDSTTAVDVIAWEDRDALPKSGTFLLDNVQVGEHNSAVQLTIREDVTEIKPIQQGMGYTENVCPSHDMQEQLEPMVDGGTVTGPSRDNTLPQNKAVETILAIIEMKARSHDLARGAPREKIVEKAQEQNISPTRTKNLLESLLSKGSIFEPSEERYLVS